MELHCNRKSTGIISFNVRTHFYGYILFLFFHLEQVSGCGWVTLNTYNVKTAG